MGEDSGEDSSEDTGEDRGGETTSDDRRWWCELPKCSADRCADGATTEGTVLAAAPKASSPAQVASTISTLSSVSGGVLGGPKKPTSSSPKTGPRTGLEKSILNTLEIVESVEK